MTEEILISIVIIVIRLLVPLSLFRWPLIGSALALAADFYDWHLLNQFGFGVWGNERYQYIDKFLDLWFLFTAFILTRSWEDQLARQTATALFSLRALGVIIFALSEWRPIFVLTPNIFENFFLFWLLVQKWQPNFSLTPKKLVAILLIIGLPKIGQESIMHWL